MATLILTAVGTAIGGPIGGALGALAGQAVDNAVLKPKGRQGPRLSELAVQTSSYGTPIAKLFGTMRVAGTVIWATDLIERASTSGGGKGRGSTTTYSYSASFAVLLSARPIRSVGRIWADGKLLRGADGAFKAPVKFRLHTGGAEQAPDPLIASAEGIAQTPALRGQAYAVLEELALADFGNRIPSLTFEVTADDAPVASGMIAEEVSGGLVAGGEATIALGGYSAYGDSLRGVIDGLAGASGAWLASDGDALRLRTGAGAVVKIADAGVGTGARGGRGVRSIAPADTAPRVVTLQHYDAARDFQTGLQRAERPGAGNRSLRIELPAVIAAGAAKTMAAAALARFDVERERRVVTLDWRAIGIAPGGRVTIAGEGGQWRVRDWSLEAMVLKLELVRIARTAVPASATPGRVIAAPDLSAGTTILHAFEIPPTDDSVLAAPRLTIAAAGTGAGWRSAGLQLSSDGGVRWIPIGATRGPATLGRIAVAAGPAPSTLIDRRHVFEVILARDDMTLGDADDVALDAGANLALVGDELVQFGRAEPIEPTRWRLSELWRGRRGTEWAAGIAGAGDRFVLLERSTLAELPLPLAALGGTMRVMATGVGDGDLPVTVDVRITGASVLPPSPAHLSTGPATATMLPLSWVRRSRAGWRWLDGIDAPLAEESESYRVAAPGADGLGRDLSIIAPAATLPLASLAGAQTIEVRQIGTFGASRPAVLTLPEL